MGADVLQPKRERHIQCPDEPGTLCDPEVQQVSLGTYVELRSDPDSACWVCIDIYAEAAYSARREGS